MYESIQGDQDPQARVRAAVAERVGEQLGWIEQTAKQIGGEDARVEDVFALPPDVRDEALAPDWNEEQETAARELGHKLGYAAERNVSSGTTGGVALLEGGKVWKLLAEAESLAVENETQAIIVSGAAFRAIGDDEKDFMVKMLGINDVDGKTEYDLARLVAEKLVGDPDEQPLPYGYEKRAGFPLIHESTKQFVRIGRTDAGQDVILMRVDQTKTEDKLFPMRRMELVAEILEISGDTESPVVFMTSNAYASRQVDAIRAGLANHREFAVNMYGRATLAEVKDEPMQPGARLNQLPGDLRVMYENLKQLQAEVTS